MCTLHWGTEYSHLTKNCTKRNDGKCEWTALFKALRHFGRTFWHFWSTQTLQNVKPLQHQLSEPFHHSSQGFNITQRKRGLPTHEAGHLKCTRRSLMLHKSSKMSKASIPNAERNSCIDDQAVLTERKRTSNINHQLNAKWQKCGFQHPKLQLCLKKTHNSNMEDRTILSILTFTGVLFFLC